MPMTKPRKRNGIGESTYYMRNRARILAKSKAWYAANRARRQKTLRAWSLATKYGLTPEQFDALLLAQGNACAICSSRRKTMCVDHDHSTGEVRGILCRSCNAMLGQVKDSTARLARAIQYLDCHKGRVHRPSNGPCESPLITVDPLRDEGDTVGRGLMSPARRD